MKEMESKFKPIYMMLFISFPSLSFTYHNAHLPPMLNLSVFRSRRRRPPRLVYPRHDPAPVPPRAGPHPRAEHVPVMKFDCVRSRSLGSLDDTSSTGRRPLNHYYTHRVRRSNDSDAPAAAPSPFSEWPLGTPTPRTIRPSAPVNVESINALSTRRDTAAAAYQPSINGHKSKLTLRKTHQARRARRPWPFAGDRAR